MIKTKYKKKIFKKKSNPDWNWNEKMNYTFLFEQQRIQDNNFDYM